MKPILIDTEQEYNYCVRQGYEPLLDTKHFQMDIFLRVKLQKRIFGHCTIGRGDVMQANARFFRWIWEHKPHICEETMKPLKNFSATYCSHILARGAFPEMAHDPRNINILCFDMHNRWENGDRENMRIYPKNLETIDTLKREYTIYRVQNGLKENGEHQV